MSFIFNVIIWEILLDIIIVMDSILYFNSFHLYQNSHFEYNTAIVLLLSYEGDQQLQLLCASRGILDLKMHLHKHVSCGYNKGFEV